MASLCYQQNLKALQSVYPGIAEQIQTTPPSPLEDHHPPSSFDWSDEIQMHILYRFAGSPLLSRLDEAVTLANLRDNRSRRLLLIEDRMAVLRRMIETQDLRHWIVSDRCLWLVHPSRQEALQDLLTQYPEISIAMIQAHKGIADVSDETLDQIVEEICAVNRSLKKTIEEALPDHIHANVPFPKTVTFFAAGHNAFQDACCRAVQAMGYEGKRLGWRNPLYRFIHRMAWFHAHRQNPIDMALFLNTSPTEFCHPDYYSVLQIPSVAWFVDNPRRFVTDHQPNYSSCDVIGVFDKTYIPFLRQHAECPVIEVRTGYGIDETAGNPGLDFSAVNVAFVGELGAQSTAVYEQAYQRLDPDIPTFVNAFLSSIDIHEPICLDHLVMHSLPDTMDLPYSGNWVTYLENKAAYLRRKWLLESIADAGLRVFGDGEWGKAEWAGKVVSSYAGKRLDYDTELPRLYATAKINLNIFHPQCVSAPNPRVYDVLACGGFLLTTYNPGLEEEFTIGEDLDVFHSPEELREKVKYYLAHPQRRRTIAKNGQQRALAKCAYSDRMALFFSALRKPWTEEFFHNTSN